MPGAFFTFTLSAEWPFTMKCHLKAMQPFILSSHWGGGGSLSPNQQNLLALSPLLLRVFIPKGQTQPIIPFSCQLQSRALA